jgi:hypothetical protein
MNMLREYKTLSEKKAWIGMYSLLGGILAVLLLITAGAGLFTENMYDNFAPPKYVQESRAQDLITLILGIPLLVVALAGIRNERTWAFPLWTGVLAYELYVYGIYAIGGVYNIFFPGYVAVASLSMYTTIGLLSNVNPEWFQKTIRTKMPRRLTAIFFLIITVIFAIIWLGQVMTTIETGIVDSGHLIFVFDLIIVLPAFSITAVRLFQKKPFGDLLAGMMLIKFDSLCVAIVLGQLFRRMNAISIEIGLLGIFIPLGLIGLALTVLYFKNLKLEVK